MRPCRADVSVAGVIDYFRRNRLLRVLTQDSHQFKNKINKGELVLAFGKGPPGGRLGPCRGAGGEPRPGPGPAGRGTGTQVPSLRQTIHSVEDCYFQKGQYNLSWQGPGYTIVNLGNLVRP